MANALYDFLSMIPHTYSLRGMHPYEAYLDGNDVCTTDSLALLTWVKDHKIPEKVERTGEVYWVRKGRRTTGEHKLWVLFNTN